MFGCSGLPSLTVAANACVRGDKHLLVIINCIFELASSVADVLGKRVMGLRIA